MGKEHSPAVQRDTSSRRTAAHSTTNYLQFRQTSNQQTEAANMTRQEYYGEPDPWDGICTTCQHDYFTCRGNCTCLSCNGQRQDEIRDKLWFDEDGARDDSNIEWREAQELALIASPARGGQPV